MQRRYKSPETRAHDNDPRAASWDDDGNFFEAVIIALTMMSATVAVCWFFWRLAEVLT